MAAPDELFLERLDAFTEKTLADINAFASREGVSVDLVRRHVAERHCSYLFDHEAPSPALNRSERVRSMLLTTSHALESLHQAAGLHSILLVVDPDNAEDEGFLGGTPLGREFWRGLRGGGLAGTKAFKAQAVTAQQSPLNSHNAQPPLIPKKETAHQLKADVYAAARNALRLTSGVRNADMKWTNHDNLSTYGVRVVGWPTDIPKQNPSSLSVSQNRLLKDCFERGTLRFCRIQEDGGQSDAPVASSSSQLAPESSVSETGDLSWAIPDGPYIPAPSAETTTVHSSVVKSNISDGQRSSTPFPIDSYADAAFVDYTVSTPDPPSDSEDSEERSRKRRRRLFNG